MGSKLESFPYRMHHSFPVVMNSFYRYTLNHHIFGGAHLRRTSHCVGEGCVRKALEHVDVRIAFGMIGHVVERRARYRSMHHVDLVHSWCR